MHGSSNGTRGDDTAFAALLMRYRRKLIRVLFRLVHDEELARDLAQETFWKIYMRLDRFDTSRRFGPWLFRVGVNLGVDMLRRHDAPPASSIDGFLYQPSRSLELADPDPRFREELIQEVRFVVDRLPLTYRTILVPARPRRFLFVRGGSNRGAARGYSSMASSQSSRPVPPALGTAAGTWTTRG